MGPEDEAAGLLLQARQDPARRPERLPDALQPRDRAQAYAVQRETMAGLGPIGGWKVGAPSADSADFTCAPLPAAAILPSPAVCHGSDRAVEAEIALLLGADLPPREAPYRADELRAAIASAHPAIEVLQSRYLHGAADPLSALADSLSHHSLVIGAPITTWHEVEFDSEAVRVLFDGVEIKRGVGNPGGEMIRLLAFLADTGARWAGGLKAGQVVTTGSWTGKDTAGAGQEARIVFERCGEATVRFA